MIYLQYTLEYGGDCGFSFFYDCSTVEDCTESVITLHISRLLVSSVKGLALYLTAKYSSEKNVRSKSDKQV